MHPYPYPEYVGSAHKVGEKEGEWSQPAHLPCQKEHGLRYDKSWGAVQQARLQGGTILADKYLTFVNMTPLLPVSVSE